ncbi:MAG: membrane integrity-associated transporter subunit PqiC [Deltaproteobacteria bacterium]|nr:membrane integrity-associated transporter subunit PqiC [Deltaproteobacteria bacterium]
MRRLIVVCLALSLMAGCGPPPPRPTYYRIDYPVSATEPSGPAVDLYLAVPPFKAPEPLARTNIIHRSSNRTLVHYQSYYWEQPPADVAHRQLVATLRAAKVFKQITTRRLALEADLTLKGRVTRFEEVDLSEGRFALVNLAVELSRPDSGTVFWSDQVEARIAVTSEGPEALAEAMSQALKECVDEVVAEVVEAARDFN